MELFIAAEGNDSWSGRHRQPANDGKDGPLATLAGARNKIRQIKRDGQYIAPITVWIGGGNYPLREPVKFDLADSTPVAYRALPGETPVFHGGERITEWTTTELNGNPVWVKELKDVKEGNWYFRRLYVNGSHRPRPRFPKGGKLAQIRDVPGMKATGSLLNGFLQGSDRFHYHPGDLLESWRNLRDIDVIVFHYWSEERMPILSLDREQSLMISSRRSVFNLRDDVATRWANYCADNVFEALSEPGEWYLDRAEGKLYYMPHPGETPDETEVIAPRLTQFISIEGEPERGRFVEHLSFDGLHFRCSDWYQPEGGDPEGSAGDPAMAFMQLANSPQGAYFVPGAIDLLGARYCAFEHCSVSQIGFYGFDLREGCSFNRIVGNEISDIGAGGVKMSGSNRDGPLSLRTGHQIVTDNHIHHGGQSFQSSIGIISRHAHDNRISHNHIHHFGYSGISCGWDWTYDEQVSRNNTIENNLIHDLGNGLLNDLGGIYMLNVQPGTVIRGNVVYNVRKRNYGAWGIYLDEASSCMLVENNVVWDVDTECFHLHFGRENIVRNNIWAFGRIGIVGIGKAEAHNSLTMTHNVFISDGAPIYIGEPRAILGQDNPLRSDMNVFWDISGQAITLADKTIDEKAELHFFNTYTLEQWRALGKDLCSLVADPLAEDAHRRRFRFPDSSVVARIGFIPFDYSAAGPRKSFAGRQSL